MKLPITGYEIVILRWQLSHITGCNTPFSCHQLTVHQVSWYRYWYWVSVSVQYHGIAIGSTDGIFQSLQVTRQLDIDCEPAITVIRIMFGQHLFYRTVAMHMARHNWLCALRSEFTVHTAQKFGLWLRLGLDPIFSLLLRTCSWTSTVHGYF